MLDRLDDALYREQADDTSNNLLDKPEYELQLAAPRVARTRRANDVVTMPSRPLVQKTIRI